MSNTTTAARVKPGRPTVITYADDFVALCHSREQAETVAARLDGWLKERGLSLNQEKTRIGRVDAGFDFLSFTIRRYYLRGGAKVLTKPSRTALKKIRQRLAQELRSLRGADPADVIRTLNPIIRGQANYYRPGASKKAFQGLDDHLWRQLYKWARRRHPRKPRRWVTARYFGAFHPTRRDRWVFGDRDSGAYLHRYAWTRSSGMRRSRAGTHPMTLPWPSTGPTGAVNADPHNWRRPGNAPCAPNTDAARCAREPLLHVDDPPDSCTQWETWYRGIRTALAHQAITQNGSGRTIHRLVHTDCARRHPGAGPHDPDQRRTMPDRPRGLLEPCAGTTGTHGSEGAPAQQCAGATRQRPALGARCDLRRGPVPDPHRAAPQVMASLRNLAISLHRLAGATNIAAALRHHSRNAAPATPATHDQLTLPTPWCEGCDVVGAGGSSRVRGVGQGAVEGDRQIERGMSSVAIAGEHQCGFFGCAATWFGESPG